MGCFPEVVNTSTGQGNIGSSDSYTLTFDHTTDDDLCGSFLTVSFAACQGGPTGVATSVTYGGQSLTRLRGTAYGSGTTTGRIAIWGLLFEAPTTGTNTVSIVTNYTGATNVRIVAGAITYRFVDKVMPVLGRSDLTSSTPPVSHTLTHASSRILVLDIASSNTSGDLGAVPDFAGAADSGQTELWTLQQGGSLLNVAAGQSTRPGTNGSATMGWDDPSIGVWGSIILPIQGTLRRDRSVLGVTR